MDHAKPPYKERACRHKFNPRNANVGGERAYLGDCSILLDAVDKLFIRQLFIVILVHGSEDLVHSLYYRITTKVLVVSPHPGHGNRLDQIGPFRECSHLLEAGLSDRLTYRRIGQSGASHRGRLPHRDRCRID